MQFPSGLLNIDGSPTPALMDAIRHSETGHLNDAQAVGAVSKKDAIGPYQLLRKNLHQMGYKMPKNISEADATGIDTSRALAAKYVKGYNQHHNFTNPLHSLAAFNMGPTAAARCRL
jgi:soluble lytic murein transglycosylase-like protein